MLRTLILRAKEYRLLFLLFVFLPVSLGSYIALKYDGGGISQFYYAISIAAILLLQAGTLALNRFFGLFFRGDIIQKLTNIISDVKGHLKELTTPSIYLAVGCMCLGFCVLIGLYIAITRTLLLLPVGVIGVGMGMFYSVPPLKRKFRLIGLTAWFLTVPLCALGAFMVQVPIPSLETLAQHSGTFWLIVAVCLPLALVGTMGNYLLENYSPPEKA